MAERKKRGLGRGLGALIPDAAANDRPVDVFFSGGNAEEQARGTEEAKSTRTRRADPAASMQSSRRRKSKAASGGEDAAVAETKSSAKTAKKTSGAKSAGAKSAGAKGTAAKGAATSTKKAGSTTTASKASAPRSGGARASSSTTKSSASTNTGTQRVGTKTSPASSAKNAAPSSDIVEETPVVSAAERSDVDDVQEQHPGVYTSRGTADDAEKSGTEDAIAASSSATSVEAEDTTQIVNAEMEGIDHGGEPDAVDATASDDADDVDEAGSASDDAGVDSIPDTAFGEIDVALVDPNPRQPRTVFDEDQLAELVHSIREIGVLQPVVVRRKPGEAERYELIMGERRLRATKEAGLETIPAIVRYVDDTDLLRDALLENLHRAELNPLEEAAAYGQLLEDFGCTQEELSERIGRSRPQISNTLRLLRLPPLVQRRVAAGVISAGHARAILGLKDPEQMEVLAQRIVAEGLSVRASEEAVVLLNRGDSVNVSRATSRVAPEFIEVAERLGDRLDTKVNITVGKRKGKLSVEFANQEDLDRILSLLGVTSHEQ